MLNFKNALNFRDLYTGSLQDYLENLIKRSFNEDVGEGDHTTLATIPMDAKGSASLLVKEEGIIAGIQLAEELFKHHDPNISLVKHCNDGDKVEPGTKAFTVEGNVGAILTAERLVLNFIQYLSGVSTKANRLVQQVKDYNVGLLDTRKTTPGLRLLEKWAVCLGGCHNHRLGLYDMAMIKDNHIDYSGSVTKAVENVKQYLNRNGLALDIIVEARNMNEVEEVKQVGGVKRVLFDNMTPEQLKAGVESVNGIMETEASGGIKEADLRTFAATGVDYISSSELTRDIHSLDFSLKLNKA